MAELLRQDETLAPFLGTVTGRDPALFAGMLSNVERLLHCSREMEMVTVSFDEAILFERMMKGNGSENGICFFKILILILIKSAVFFFFLI